MKLTTITFLFCFFTFTVFAQSREASIAPSQLYCHLCDSAEIVKLLPAGFTLLPNQRLQWAAEGAQSEVRSPKTRVRGRLTLLELSGPCLPVRVIWQSKRETLTKAVRDLKRGKHVR